MFAGNSLFILLINTLILTTNAANPNFILILTDDQDILLNGMIPMESTLRLVADKGKTFQNAFVNSPICCPSRSTILTGKYAHNTGVTNNSVSGGCSSQKWQDNHEPFSIAAILRKEKNYVNFYGGKYLNQYGFKNTGGTKHVPTGYDWWIGLKGNSKYYNYTLSINGSVFSFTDTYLTDLLAEYSISFLDNRPRNRPFFMTIAPPASHAPFTPAMRHTNRFNNTKAVRTPAFNHTAYDKHWIVQMPPRNLPATATILDDIQRRRLQSLLAVDEMIEKVIGKLEEQNALENTYLVFTSDNGFHIGQFSQPWDKRQPYDTDIRVPLLISGPKIPKKSIEQYAVSAVDLAPTILDLADVRVPKQMDGESFKERLLSRIRVKFRRIVFVEYWGEGNDKSVDNNCPSIFDPDVSECSKEQWCKCQDARNNTYTCFIDITNDNNFKFCQFEDDVKFVEAYNLTTDPYELSNIAEKISLRQLEDCNVLLDNYRYYF